MHDDPTTDSSAPEPEAPRYVAQIETTNKRLPHWTLALYSEWLVLSPNEPVPIAPQPVAYPAPPAGYQGAPTGPPQFVYSRRDLGTTLNLHRGMITNRMLEFQTPLGRFTSLLPDDTLAQVNQWIGPVTQADLATELRKRIAYLLPLALLFVVSSFTCQGHRAVDVGGVSLEPVALVLGGLLVVIYLLGRYRPRRYVFLLDALWWCIMAADNAYDLHLGHGSGLSYLLIAVAFWLMYGEVRAYVQFAPQPAEGTR